MQDFDALDPGLGPEFFGQPIDYGDSLTEIAVEGCQVRAQFRDLIVLAIDRGWCHVIATLDRHRRDTALRIGARRPLQFVEGDLRRTIHDFTQQGQQTAGIGFVPAQCCHRVNGGLDLFWLDRRRRQLGAREFIALAVEAGLLCRVQRLLLEVHALDEINATPATAAKYQQQAGGGERDAQAMEGVVLRLFATRIVVGWHLAREQTGEHHVAEMRPTVAAQPHACSHLIDIEQDEFLVVGIATMLLKFGQQLTVTEDVDAERAVARNQREGIEIALKLFYLTEQIAGEGHRAQPRHMGETADLELTVAEKSLPQAAGLLQTDQQHIGCDRADALQQALAQHRQGVDTRHRHLVFA